MAGLMSRLALAIGKALQPVPSTAAGGYTRDSAWYPIIREPYTGAWQRNHEIRNETVLAYSAVYACVTLIASDVSKMNLRLVEKDASGIWSETDSAAFSPVLRKPNRYQTRIKFIESWVTSKLTRGNAIILKERDARRVVVGLYVLDWLRCKPLIAPDGAVYYELSRNDLAGVEEPITVPASEIIHDTMCPLFHPLCGVSPLFACGYAAMQGLSIQGNSHKFYTNGSLPGGILSTPEPLTDERATQIKKRWEDSYAGENAGRVAVIGDGMKFERMAMTAVESQMIEQLKWTGETVASCFHVPAYMIGIGAPPSYNNIEALNQQYYSQCLQSIMESIELCLDEGLGLDAVPGKTYGTEFDLDDLLRMDTATQYKTIGDGIGAALITPNEGRRKIGLKPLAGGNTVYMQEQNYSLADLNKRSQMENPFEAKAPAPAPAPPAEEEAEDDIEPDEALDDEAAKYWAAAEFRKAMAALPGIGE